MRGLTHSIMYSLLGILGISALISFGGLLYLWGSGQQELPYLWWLLSITVGDGVALLFLFARRGLGYMPTVTISKTEDHALDVMGKLLQHATSVAIVSNRASWLGRSSKFRASLMGRARAGVSVEIITRIEVPAEVHDEISESGVKFSLSGDGRPPEARFTLINEDRAGAEVLAIARGVLPKHEITLFDNDSGPQMIAMAKDILRKLRSGAHANEVV